MITNHKLLVEQEEELRTFFGVNKILYLPYELSSRWVNINPVSKLDLVSLNQVADWIKKDAQEGDYILIQGEFGATFYITDFCKKNGYIPIYAAAERIYKEKREKDGSVSRNHVFRHKQFREYKAWGEL